MAQTFETLRKYPGTSEKMLQKAIEQATKIVKVSTGLRKM